MGTEFEIGLVSNLILIYICRCDRAEHGVFLEALASSGGLELVVAIFVLWGVALFDSLLGKRLLEAGVLSALAAQQVLGHARLLLWSQRWQLRRVEMDLRDWHVAAVGVRVACIALGHRLQCEASVVVEALPNTRSNHCFWRTAVCLSANRSPSLHTKKVLRIAWNHVGERVCICLLKHLQLLGRLGYERTVHGGTSHLIHKRVAPVYICLDLLYRDLFLMRLSVVVGHVAHTSTESTILSCCASHLHLCECFVVVCALWR